MHLDIMNELGGVSESSSIDQPTRSQRGELAHVQERWKRRTGVEQVWTNED